MGLRENDRHLCITIHSSTVTTVRQCKLLKNSAKLPLLAAEYAARIPVKWGGRPSSMCNVVNDVVVECRDFI